METSEYQQSMLKRIAEIAVTSNGFNKETMRWGNFSIKVDGILTPLAGGVDFTKLSADDLVNAFEKIVIRNSRQM